MLGKVFNFQLKKENQDLKSNKAGKDKKKDKKEKDEQIKKVRY